MALYHGAFGGAAKRNRWAARIPTHHAEPSGQPERPRIITYHWVSQNISGHIRTYPDISGHIRTCHDRRVRKEPVPDRVPYGRSRAKGAGAGSRAIKSVACERSRCRIACHKVSRVREELVPDTVGRMVVACGRTRRRIASRPSPAHLGDLTSLRCSRSDERNARRRPCPGPTAPVTDAATGGLRTCILLHCRGVLGWLRRRRG